MRQERFGRKEGKRTLTQRSVHTKSKIAIAATRCPNCTSMLNTADESENSDTFIAWKLIKIHCIKCEKSVTYSIKLLTVQ